MFSRPERLIAFRYLRPSRSDRFVSVITGFSFLGIMLGVATLVVVMAVMNGFRQELYSKILGMNAHIAVFAEHNGALDHLGDYENLREQIAKIPNVVSATPVIEGQVMASSKGKSAGVLVRGFAPEDLAKKPVFKNGIVAGDLASLHGLDSIMIGYKLAQKLGLRVGDRITLVSPQGQVTAFGTIPRIRAYPIVAVFNAGMFEYDSSFVYLPLESAQTFFGFENSVSAIEINTDNAFKLDHVKTELMRRLPDNVQISDWQRAHSSFFNAIAVERNVMFLILTLIIVVAAFNIISGLVMLVKDKSNSIAILRTMGATRGTIMRIFFLAGASVGVVGTIFGLLLGILFAENIESIRQFLQSLSGTELFSDEIYFLSKLPAEIEWGEVISVAAMSLGLSFLATLYPSWRAARLDPVEALRYE